MPSLSVVHTRAVAAQERRAGRLLAAEADRPVEQARHEPLEADRHLQQPPAERRRRPGRSSTRTPAVLPIAASARQPSRAP